MNFYTLLISFAVFHFHACLYEDQVGTFDWHKEFIGRITWSSFLYSYNAPTKVLVHSDRVLACLESKTGNVVWRRVFSDINGTVINVLHKDSRLYSVHSVGLVRSWDVSTGHIISETVFITSSNEFGNPILYSLFDSKGNVYIIRTNKVIAVSPQFGTIEWSRDITLNSKVLCSLSGSFLHIVSKGPEKSVKLTAISILTGNTKYENVVKLDSDICTLPGNQFLICVINSELLAFRVNEEIQNNPEFKIELPSSNEIVSITSVFPFSSFITVHFANGALSLFSIKDNKFELFRHFTHSVGIVGYHSRQNSTSLAVITSEENNYKLILINGETSEVVLNQAVTFGEINGKINHFSIYMPDRPLSTDFRILATFEDYTLSMFSASGKIWHREEALSEIVTVQFCDLPLSEIQTEIEFEFQNENKATILDMLVHRIYSQGQQLHTYYNAFEKMLRRNSLLKQCTADESELTRDQFNINKMIIALTSVGKVYGILSASGKIIWNKWLPDLSILNSEGRLISNIYIQRSTAHFAYAPIASISGKDTSSGQFVLYKFNPITGELYCSDCKMDFIAKQAVLLPIHDEKHTKVLTIIDSNAKLHFSPSSDYVIKQFIENSDKFFFYLLDEKNTLSGYALSDAKDLSLSKIWHYHFGNPITHIIPKRVSEKVDSPGKVLGDRSVLFKYLNPNLLFIVVKNEEEKGTFTIYLLDSVNGNIVFSAIHKRVRLPINAVHSENWVVYSFWNERLRRTEICVLELYDSGYEFNSTSFSSFGQHMQPLVLRQSYIFAHPIRFLSTTYSDKGLTNKQILVATPNGAVISIPKFMLDPRRPLVLSPIEREEGLFPYVPELMVPSENILNYNRSVNLLRSIDTFPSGLESTVFVFVYGLDVFFTRDYPSKMFDVLKDDFEFWFIAFVMSILIAGSLVAKKLAVTFSLRRLWK